MRLLVTEYISGGGLVNHPLPDRLKQEGLMMLQSLVADCFAIENCNIVTTLDPRIQLDHTNIEIHLIETAKDYMHKVRTLAKESDLTWVIAPESEGVLASIIHSLTKEGISTLNCDVESIRISGDKLSCANVLSSIGLPVIPTLAYEDLEKHTEEVLIKPRFGVGCEGLQVLPNGKKAMELIDIPERWIAQPYIKGDHRSMSLLCWHGRAKILSCNIQEFSDFVAPKLQKCIVNAFPITAELESISKKIASALPGLNGYVGVDYIETKNGCVIAEINPRLTMSYIGLAKALQLNPARLCIDTVKNNILPFNIENTGRSIEVALD